MADGSKTCSIVEDGELCGKRVVAWGRCAKHDRRWRKHGDPLIVKRKVQPAPVDGLCKLDCDRPHFAHGLCSMHYQRKRHTGDPLARRSNHHLTLAERFWPKVDKNGPVSARRPDLGRCWIWIGNRHRQGYGMFRDGKMVYAHRFAYELLVGPIPEGLTIDHLCVVTSCVNPAHMEPVTMAVNALRGDGPPARNARKSREARETH